MKTRMVKKILLLFIMSLILTLSIIALWWLYHITANKKAAEKVTKQFMQAYVQQDAAVCEKLLLNGRADAVEFSGAQEALSKTITYKILGSRWIDDDVVAVSLEIENVCFSKIMENVMTNLQGELTENYIVTTIMATSSQPENRKVYPCEAIVYCGSEQKIQITSNFSNALLGGLNEYITSLLSGKEET